MADKVRELEARERAAAEALEAAESRSRSPASPAVSVNSFDDYPQGKGDRKSGSSTPRRLSPGFTDVERKQKELRQREKELEARKKELERRERELRKLDRSDRSP